MKETRVCKACGAMLPIGNTPASYAARKMGYCSDCYEMNFPMRKARSRYKKPGNNASLMEIPAYDSDTFNPAAPWDWYEYFFPEKER